MNPEIWEWATGRPDAQRSARIAFIREIPFDTGALTQEDPGPPVAQPEAHGTAKALSLNLSPGGMLLLMDCALELNQVLRLHIPTPTDLARTPTLAEVRWIRSVPFAQDPGLHFVGVRFLL